MKDKGIPDTRVYILEKVTPLFAAQGCNGVSMRELSKAVGLSAAAIYHHFTDKKTLYLEVMKHAFLEKTSLIEASLSHDGSVEIRLEEFIESFAKLLGDDPSFRALVLWALLDDDKVRVKLVAEEVFFPPFNLVRQLLEEIEPKADHYMLTISIVWLAVSHFATVPMCQYLPGWRPEYAEPTVISKHIMVFLIKNMHSRLSSESVETRVKEG